MNAVEQKNHKRVTDAIANDVATIAEATADRLDAIEQRAIAVELDVFANISEEITARLKMADEQREFIVAVDGNLRRYFESLYHRGFWGRMKWIVRGI